MSVMELGDSTGDSVVRSVRSFSSWVIEVDDRLQSVWPASSIDLVSDVSDGTFTARPRALNAMLLLRSDLVPSSSEDTSPSAEYGTTESKIDRID